MAITILRPTVNGSNNTWGTTINSGLEALESTLNGTGTGKVTIEPDLTLGAWSIGGSVVTSTAAEVNLLDGSTANAVVDGRAVIYGDNGELRVEQAVETVTIDTSTSGDLNFDVNTQAIIYLTIDQTADRTINFRGDASTTLDSVMSVGQSMTFAVLATQGTTAYYLNAYKVDGTVVTPKWAGSAPTGGTADAINTYAFTIIKTAAATFTVLASVSNYA